MHACNLSICLLPSGRKVTLEVCVQLRLLCQWDSHDSTYLMSKKHQNERQNRHFWAKRLLLQEKIIWIWATFISTQSTFLYRDLYDSCQCPYTYIHSAIIITAVHTASDEEKLWKKWWKLWRLATLAIEPEWKELTSVRNPDRWAFLAAITWMYLLAIGSLRPRHSLTVYSVEEKIDFLSCVLLKSHRFYWDTFTARSCWGFCSSARLR